MTTIYRGSVLFRGGGQPTATGAIDCWADGRVSIGVLGSDDMSERGATLRTLVSRPDPDKPNEFEEHGQIAIDGMGSISIETFAPGGDGPSVDRGWIRGYAVFKITNGDGAFAGASGYVTTNFSLDPDGLLYDSEALMITVP